MTMEARRRLLGLVLLVVAIVLAVFVMVLPPGSYPWMLPAMLVVAALFVAALRLLGVRLLGFEL